jgi:hypothetical protein
MPRRKRLNVQPLLRCAGGGFGGRLKDGGGIGHPWALDHRGPTVDRAAARNFSIAALKRRHPNHDARQLGKVLFPERYTQLTGILETFSTGFSTASADQGFAPVRHVT